LALAVQQVLPAGGQDGGKDNRLAGTMGLGASLLALILCLSPLGSQAAKYPEPLTAIDKALATAPPGSIVFTDLGLSGWLLWRHPALATVADLRVETYSAQHLRAYVTAEEARPGWDRFMEETDSTYALVRTDSAIAGALEDRMGWHARAHSSHYVLLSSGGSVTQ
jgi:hypothetical protein